MGVFAGRARPRWATFFLCCLMALLLYSFAVPTSQLAFAQEGEPEEPKKDDSSSKPTPKTEKGSGDVIANLVHIIKSIGWFMGPILAIVSIALVALVVLLAMDLRMSVAIPPGFVEDFTDTVNKRKFKEAFELTRGENSFLSNVLSAGMGRLQYGIEDARQTAFNMVETVRASKEQFITYLATIGTLGPMLGLVGTVYGMIGAFRALGTNNQSALAEALSHSLAATLCGIFLSLPAIFCHALFRNRLIRISMETSNLADDLLTQMYHNSKRPAAPTAAPAPAAVVVGESRATAASGVKPVQ